MWLYNVRPAGESVYGVIKCRAYEKFKFGKRWDQDGYTTLQKSTIKIYETKMTTTNLSLFVEKLYIFLDVTLCQLNNTFRLR